MRNAVFILLSVLAVQLFSQNEVIYSWSGAITFNSAKVNAKMSDTSATIRLVVDDDSTFSSPNFSIYYSVDSSTNYMVSMDINGLAQQTKYFYAVEAGGVIDLSAEDVGSFKTFANGPFSYSFVIGSCIINGEHKVFDVMKNMSPSFYINMGDLHYENPNSGTDINIHRLPYENAVLSKTKFSQFLKNVPITYVWDDHDFSGNNSDSSFVGKENARIAYHEYVPHYPLAFGFGPTKPIAQSFTVGRVHFILTDLRSERYTFQIMKPAQRAWFESECLYARDNNLIIAWMSTYSWYGTGTDNWAFFSSERTDINDFFYCNDIKNLFILSGDAHMLAIDNGINGNFSSSSCPSYSYPVFQAAAIVNGGSYKGGVFSEGGYFMNPDNTVGQFGKVDVYDSGGDSICIAFEGYRVDSTGSALTLMNSYDFCRLLPNTSVFFHGNSLVNSIRIQPNPSNSLNIHFQEKVLLKSIKIYSTNGNLVRIDNANVFTFEYSLTLNELNSACYIVQIETENGIAKKYWIKNK